MDRAEERALEQYPSLTSSLDRSARAHFRLGYHQAEKDLALTWIDIRNILSIADEVEQENDCNVKVKSDLCEEVLRRFMKLKDK